MAAVCAGLRADPAHVARNGSPPVNDFQLKLGLCLEIRRRQSRATLRRKLIGQNPVLWLACRERWQSLGVWALAVLVTGVFLGLLVAGLPDEYWIIWNWLSSPLGWLLYLWAASQACRFFIEARRSGLIELLLATPVSEREIVHGQWRALLRLFAVPVVLLLGVQLAGACVSTRIAWRQTCPGGRGSCAAGDHAAQFRHLRYDYSRQLHCAQLVWHVDGA